MKQKLAIARALLHDPAVVFLDEPTAALDPEAAFLVRESIETLRKAGRTIILATHNLDEADRLCDRIAFVRAGLVRIDTPAALRGGVGTRRLTVRLASGPTKAILDTVRAMPGVDAVEAVDGVLRVGAADPEVDRALGRARVGRRRRGRRRGPHGTGLAGADLLRGHGRATGRRRHAGGRLMRPGIIWTILRREWLETFRNRLLMSTILLPPILLTVAPIALAGAVGSERLPPELATQVLAQRPEWASLTPGELAGAFAVQQFLVFFLLMPAYIPLSIATFSIIGEKQARSLEPVLAAPIRTSELLAGKAIAALVPGVLAGWATYVVFVLLASVVYGPALFGVVTDGSWLAGAFVLGPAVGLSSVVAGVIVSARVNDPRVAQQIGGVIIVPIVGLVLVQATGTLLVGPVGYAVLAAIILGISLVGLRVGVRLFDRESILTRWR